MCTEVSADVSLHTKMYLRHVCVTACSIVGIWCLDAHIDHRVHSLKSYTPLVLVHTYIRTYTSIHVVTHIKHITQEYT